MAESNAITPVPSFDIDSEEFSDFDEQEAIFVQAEATFAEVGAIPSTVESKLRKLLIHWLLQDEIDFMISVLKERGLFYFIKLFVEEKAIEISRLLLIFGVQLPLGVISIVDQLRVLKVACSRV